MAPVLSVILHCQLRVHDSPVNDRSIPEGNVGAGCEVDSPGQGTACNAGTDGGDSSGRDLTSWKGSTKCQFSALARAWVAPQLLF